MIWPLLAVALASGPEVYAYNPGTETAWCAPEPVPRAKGLEISAEAFRAFPLPKPWCSPGVVMETAAEHKAHKQHGPCEVERAIWQAAMRKIEREFRQVQEEK